MWTGHLTIRHDGPRVQIIDRQAGKLLADITPQLARDLADALKHAAGRAEEIVERERIVFDQAILQRVGLPIGLIHDPHLRHQAGVEAAWNSDLRRYLPGGMKLQAEFGVPAVIRGPAPTPQRQQED